MPHQTMDDQARSALEEQSSQLRAELKKWESDWAGAHGGKKPGRDDIKRNPDIAQRYKEYNKLRDVLAGKLARVEAAVGRHHRKRALSEAAMLPPQTPSKRLKPVQTPRKDRHSHAEALPPGTLTPGAAAAAAAAADAALSADAAVPTSISPTPQKDGRVLGLFDLLAGTPSRGTALAAPPASGTGNPAPAATTPSRRRATDGGVPPAMDVAAAATPTTARLVSTPQSKRTANLLFVAAAKTPLHARRDNGNAVAAANTPFKTPSTSRVAKPRSTPTSATPSFLRRRTVSSAAALSRVDEQDETGGCRRVDDDGAGAGEDAWVRVGPLRLPRRLGFGRTLSSVVAGLRKMEEEAFADEEEAMREMESGPGGEAGVEVWDSQAQPGRDRPERRGTAHREVELGDGGDNGGKQKRPRTGLLSGFDDEAFYDSSDEDDKDQTPRPAVPLRTFRKRGQKRTTRLVNMRPTRAKRPVRPEREPDGEKGDEEEEPDAVPETQLGPAIPQRNTKNDDDDLHVLPHALPSAHPESEREPELDDDDDNGFDPDEVYEAEGSGPQNRPVRAQKTKTATAQKTAKPKNDDKSAGRSASASASGVGVVRRAARKVKATAHANFKRLKLRNSGAKGGPGQSSRWRRRR